MEILRPEPVPAHLAGDGWSKAQDTPGSVYKDPEKDSESSTVSILSSNNTKKMHRQFPSSPQSDRPMRLLDKSSLPQACVMVDCRTE